MVRDIPVEWRREAEMMLKAYASILTLRYHISIFSIAGDIMVNPALFKRLHRQECMLLM